MWKSRDNTCWMEQQPSGRRLNVISIYPGLFPPKEIAMWISSGNTCWMEQQSSGRRMDVIYISPLSRPIPPEGDSDVDIQR